MRKFIYIGLIISFVSIAAFAQTQPFKDFSETVKNQSGGFNGNNENLSSIFNQERIRLGENFETELWKYLGEDVEKYYWISAYLDWKGYLHGSAPLPELAFKIRQRGVELIGNTEDKENLGRKITFLRDLAIASYLSGNRDAAVEYKKRTTPIYQKYDDIGAYVGATTEFAYCIYNNLEKDASICREDEVQPKETIINGGILNGKATSLPFPKYPQAARKDKASGIVSVKVIIDTDGKVVSAEGFEGNPKLFDAAIEAAKKAKFKPTKLSGKLVKVSGVLIYRFIY